LEFSLPQLGQTAIPNTPGKILNSIFSIKLCLLVFHKQSDKRLIQIPHFCPF
jgi:hypothetical protein